MSEKKIIRLKATVSYKGSTQTATVDITPYVVKNAYFATKKEEIVYDKDKKEKGRKITFTPLTKASISEDIYIVVETKDLQGKTIKINVRQGKEKVIGEKDKALTITQNEQSITEIQACVGELADYEKHLNKDYLKNLAVAQVTLAPKGEKNTEDWVTKINATTDKKAYLYLLVQADIKEKVKYNGKNADGSDDYEQRFGNAEGKWLELKVEEYKVCPIDPNYRSHFIIHCTAGNMTKSSIASKTTYYVKKKKKTKRSGGHVYVMKDGSQVVVWPLTEKNVWATKIESKKSLKGQMFHIELNYGPPDKPTEAQYQTLADLYEEASKIQKCWPIIVPHIEIDRGYASGHQDPTDFDYNHFYSILKQRGIPIDTIPKFDHNRYWGHKSYKVPWSTDKTNWPPILTGNPHK